MIYYDLLYSFLFQWWLYADDCWLLEREPMDYKIGISYNKPNNTCQCLFSIQTEKAEKIQIYFLLEVKLCIQVEILQNIRTGQR